ncbi:hypothetical protein SAMN04487946_109120 [Halobellus clavatus]|uniref:Uncharacterized protein n=1 Tax=Halobellus clavatus TaxID=660517 RepID=A0A1H3IC45_9EURY|nr:hypothetical protein SAMN04487946_109120 [Halobellus clavatus]
MEHGRFSNGSPTRLKSTLPIRNTTISHPTVVAEEWVRLSSEHLAIPWLLDIWTILKK